MPFYSYPSKWNDSKDENAAHILLEIPWKKADDSEYVTYRYQIPVNFDLNNEIVRNNIYKLRIDVGILGALQGVVELTPSYYVVDWKTMTINTELSRPQYLVVDQNHVVMNNVEEFSVGYSSSDEVTVTIRSTTINTLYSQNNNKYDAVYGPATVSNDASSVTLTHQLDNTRDDKQYDFKAQTFVVRIAHKNNSSIYEDITFKQYPAMYVDPVVSSGNVIINSNKSNNVGSVWWYNYAGFLSSKNLYVVNVSAFDESTKDYQICDPRVPSNTDTFIFHEVNYDTDTDGDEVESEDITGTNLIGYRGAVEGSASRYLVAPSFMIASSAGAYNSTTTLSSKCLEYRCAAYQEDGYPAGRWRLPTPAELEVVGKLCSEGKVESIFYNNYTYASSDGLYAYSEDSGTFTKSNDELSRSVRCVYDIWYWDDVCQNKSQFIWGAEGNVAALKASGNYKTYFKSVE